MGDIKQKEQAIVTLTSSLGALINNGGGVANGTANLDCRSGGNAAQLFAGDFELTCRWGTVTGIVSGTTVADLYLVPAEDGTNFAQTDIANATTDYLQPFHYAGSFSNALHNPSTATDYIFTLSVENLKPRLYKAYLINRSGQTYTANATLKFVGDLAQYT